MGSKIPGKVMKNKIFFVAVAIYIVLAFTSTDNLAKSLGTACYYLVEMIQIMPVVFILTALIDAWIPQQVISRRLGSRAGFMGNVFALILGSLSAGPIYAAFPICKILLKKGTSLANISIILGAWAVVKVPMLLNEIKFIGVDFMIVRWIFTVIAILVMGHILGMLVDEKDIPQEADNDVDHDSYVNADACVGCGICVKLAPRSFVIKDKKASVVSTKDMVQILEAAQKCPVNAIIVEEGLEERGVYSLAGDGFFSKI